jgi:hypothetical protein
MANPNIVNVTTIQGKTAVLVIAATNNDVIANAGSSGKIIKVNSLVVSNTSSTSHTVTVDLFRSSTSYKIASTVSVPANSSLVVIGKESSIYLEEGDTVRSLASSASVLHLVASYEEIS